LASNCKTLSRGSNPLDASNMQTTCSKCQHSNPSYSLFCSQCGSKLPTPKKEETNLAGVVDDLFLESRRKHYPALSMISVMFILFGWALVAIGTIGMLANAGPLLAMNSNGRMPPSEDNGEFKLPAAQVIYLIGSSLIFMSGLFFLAYGEMLQLLIDLQHNNDKHTIILYSLFRLKYLEQNKAPPN
jgi:hypothetical protein